MVQESAKPDLVILASGSEVSLALAAAELLAAKGKATRVVSVPCREQFMAQPPEYLNRLLGAKLPLVVIEAGVGSGWRQLVGRNGLVIGMERFGVSGPANELASNFGFSPEALVEAISAHFVPRV